ncbi:hypothetical protein BHE74_00054458 [Ensete ventricosum]|nr:hypothetical protein BHE74_00054458 [Ensete ventricosum]
MVPDTLPIAYCQEPYRLVGPSHLACHVVIHPLSGVLQAGWPIAVALSGCQPPIGGGAVGWSVHCVCSTMSPAPYHVVDHLLSGTLWTRSRLRLSQLDLARPHRNPTCSVDRPLLGPSERINKRYKSGIK